MTNEPPPDRGADIANYLASSLDVYRGEHEEGYAGPETTDEERLHSAMSKLERYALELVTTGSVPLGALTELDQFMPGSSLDDKLSHLLAYDLVQDRLQFSVAEWVVWQLDDLASRVRLSAIALSLLLRSAPSPTAVKYFERASKLFLAGYKDEVLVMCGAVLEAAMAARFPDDLLKAAGLRPAYRRTGVFSLGQRMEYEEDHPLLDSAQRRDFWKVVNWRNDAVHVQPDLGPNPMLALLTTVWLLPVIMPKASFP